MGSTLRYFPRVVAQRLDFDRTLTDTADHLAPSADLGWLQALAAGPSSDASTAGAPQVSAPLYQKRERGA